MVCRGNFHIGPTGTAQQSRQWLPTCSWLPPRLRTFSSRLSGGVHCLTGGHHQEVRSRGAPVVSSLRRRACGAYFTTTDTTSLLPTSTPLPHPSEGEEEKVPRAQKSAIMNTSDFAVSLDYPSGSFSICVCRLLTPCRRHLYPTRGWRDRFPVLSRSRG